MRDEINNKVFNVIFETLLNARLMQGLRTLTIHKSTVQCCVSCDHELNEPNATLMVTKIRLTGEAIKAL